MTNWKYQLLSTIAIFTLPLATPSIAATTYLFNQTDNAGGMTTGTITLNNGTWIEQGIADILNAANYSITISNANGSSLTFNQDNSTWIFGQFEESSNVNVDYTFKLETDGTNLNFFKKISTNNQGLFTEGFLSIQSDNSSNNYFSFGHSVSYSALSGRLRQVDFLRQADIFNGGNLQTIFYSLDSSTRINSYPSATEITYSFSAASTPTPRSIPEPQPLTIVSLFCIVGLAAAKRPSNPK